MVSKAKKVIITFNWKTQLYRIVHLIWYIENIAEQTIEQFIIVMFSN